MFVDMIVFSWLAIRYKPISLDLLKDEDEEEKKLPLENDNIAFDARE
jgi:hypothetical protein